MLIGIERNPIITPMLPCLTGNGVKCSTRSANKQISFCCNSYIFVTSQPNLAQDSTNSCCSRTHRPHRLTRSWMATRKLWVGVLSPYQYMADPTADRELNLLPRRSLFMAANSQWSLGARSGEQGECWSTSMPSACRAALFTRTP